MNNQSLMGAAAGLLLAGGGLLAAPAITGSQMEHRFREAAREHPRIGAAELYLISYERGYYRSEALTRLQIAGPDGAPLQVDVKHRIVHGLGLGGFNLGRITSTPEFQGDLAPLNQVFGSEPPLRVVTVATLGGAVEGQIYSPAYIGALGATAAPAQLRWDGISGQYHYEESAVRLSLKAPGLQIQPAAGGAGLDLRDLGLDMDLLRSEQSGLWLGRSAFTLGTLTFALRDQLLRLGGASFDTEAREQTGAVQLTVAYGLKELNAASDFNLSDALLRLSVSNLDAAALKAYAEAAEAINAASEPERVRLALQSLQQLLPSLLSRPLRLAIEEGRFTYNGAPVSLTGSLQYVGDIDNGFNPATDLEGEAVFEAPEDFFVGTLGRRSAEDETVAALDVLETGAAPDADTQAQRARQRGRLALQRLVDRGLLMPAAGPGRYLVRLRLNQSGATINGAPLSGLPDLS